LNFGCFFMNIHVKNHQRLYKIVATDPRPCRSTVLMGANDRRAPFDAHPADTECLTPSNVDTVEHHFAHLSTMNNQNLFCDQHYCLLNFS
jgi:hypothetical protein